MNAVEIEEAVTRLADTPFDPENFPYSFLEAFDNKETTIKKLRSGVSNKSDIGGVLQFNNIHLVACATGQVSQTLKALKASRATLNAKARFILATDGIDFEAEDLTYGETVVCAYKTFPDHFGFFLPLAGITTVRQITENAFDIRATSRLNRLYVTLLKDNPEWGTAARQHDMNHFLARLIFCFFAEDTGIFTDVGSFTQTIETMSTKDSSNTHKVIGELFRAMNTDPAERANAKIPRWADAFPYVNGGLFSGGTNVPRFSKIARSYLLHIGNLDWTKINPDIFGSMIQAVAEDDERQALGMHYTSVPNILKVLNPLFLDDLRERLKEVGNNARMLLNLRNRIAKIRVFDPACGSGNFLVIAYKEMRAIEAEINKRRKEETRRSEIQKTNFRGIELRAFSAEIARLALIIAEYQCDALYRGPELALAEFLPLDKQNWITCGNALRLDWLSVCPPTRRSKKLSPRTTSSTPSELSHNDVKDEEAETYICGNPPYLGSTLQSAQQKADLSAIFGRRTKHWKSLDYVAGWFMLAADYGLRTNAASSFVSTNSLCQGQQVPILWPLIFQTGHEIASAHTSFKWANLATHKAGVTVVIVNISNHAARTRRLFTPIEDGSVTAKEVDHINAYLVPGPNIIIRKVSKPTCGMFQMKFGNKPVDGGQLLLWRRDLDELNLSANQRARLIRRIHGSSEFIYCIERYVLWIADDSLNEAIQHAGIRARIEKVRATRLASPDEGANAMASRSHQMREMCIGNRWTIIVPRTSSENRPFLPVGLIDEYNTVTSEAFAIYDAPLWNLALIASRLHLVWIATVCGKLETRYRYSNTMGWNTFPVPTLSDKNKADLTSCAEGIVLAREHHFPATIADLYDADTMPEELRQAHDRNDEVLERIYIGRRFKNDTERLEKLFDMYTKMMESATPARKLKAETVAWPQR